MTQLMRFVYCGRVDLDDCEVTKFRKILDMLRIEAVTEIDDDGDDDCIEEYIDEPEEAPLLMQSNSDPGQRRRVTMSTVVKDEAARQFMERNPLTCPFCKKLSTLTKHRNEHVKYCIKNCDRIESKCPYCDKSFCDPFYVRKHVRAIHKIEPDGRGLKRVSCVR
jgi:hypothetical protein